MKLIKFLLFLYPSLFPLLLYGVTDMAASSPPGYLSFPWQLVVAIGVLIVFLGGVLVELFRIRKHLDQTSRQ